MDCFGAEFFASAFTVTHGQDVSFPLAKPKPQRSLLSKLSLVSKCSLQQQRLMPAMQAEIFIHSFYWSGGVDDTPRHDQLFAKCTCRRRKQQYIIHCIKARNKLEDKGGFAGLRSKVPAQPHFSAWFHHDIPEQAMACTIQKVLQTINPPPEEIQQQIINSDSSERSAIALDRYETSQILGAKMLRVQQGDWTALQASKFFNYNFPCAKYIINTNTRLNTDNQVASQKNTFKRAASLELEKLQDRIKRQNDFLTQFAQYMSEDKARLIYMEEWTNNVTQLNEIVEWLGFRNCQYDKVLHNNKDGYHHDNSSIDLGGGCLAP